ncbi:hypothetical protein [Roseospira goensis]|uniref:Chromosome segregation ATPase n=1 Tax=Roseospira goensis TaxID=391922 RepID=A0A7W6S0W0_9PROT|nr:hypothetical protein [Roseospira goensis]MBB4286804.1 chromosome segregation ATPase [Roseospira goensis]
MPSPASRAAILIATLAVLTLAAGAAVAWQALADRDAHIARLATERQALRDQVAALEARRATLVSELEAALRIGERLSDRVDVLEADLAEARATQLEVREVRGTADFPIQRAMAQAGDTVAGFADREGTTAAMVRALNPWLDGTETLDGFQTLWIPKPR